MMVGFDHVVMMVRFDHVFRVGLDHVVRVERDGMVRVRFDHVVRVGLGDGWRRCRMSAARWMVGLNPSRTKFRLGPLWSAFSLLHDTSMAMAP